MDPSFPYLPPERDPSMLTVEGVTLVSGVALHAGIRTFRRLRG
jgi:hypothetical protein